MGNREGIGIGLPAVALAAGLLSGALLRPAPVQPAKHTERSAPEASRRELSAEAEPSLKAMRPVMELLVQSFGIALDPKGDLSAASTLLADPEDKGAVRLIHESDEVSALKRQLGEMALGDVSQCVQLLRTMRRLDVRRADSRSESAPKTLPSEALMARLDEWKSLESSERAEDAPSTASTAVEHLPLVRMLDMPVQNLPWPYPATLLALLLTIRWAISGPSPVDGVWFSWFLMCASATILASAFLLLAHAIEVWRRLRPGLTALSHSRVEPALASVAQVVRWNLSLVSPHMGDLTPLVSLTDRLSSQLVTLARADRDRSSPCSAGSSQRSRSRSWVGSNRFASS
jgi:hypothetical protein